MSAGPLIGRPAEAGRFTEALLAWYRRHGRHDMPWRTTSDPYAVFLSEFMLQQTTVATVLPYYERFLERFPTLASLAQADLNDVLALWSGLGYYARARNLWAAAKAVHTDLNGRLPQTPERLQELPGIGPYTAGAIAAFAFNAPAAVLDANIIRVLMRIMAIEDDPKMKPVQAVLRTLALELNLATAGSAGRFPKKGGPRDLNLALMDLGATLCAPKGPDCAACPVAEFCLARQHGRQDDIPIKGERGERVTVRRLVAALSLEGRWLMAQRPPEKLFGGLWEMPGVDAPAGEEPVPLLERGVREETGIAIRVLEALAPFEHHLSHRVLVIRPFLCEPKSRVLKKSGRQYERFRWVSDADLARLGLSSITKRLLAEVRRPGRRRAEGEESSED